MCSTRCASPAGRRLRAPIRRSPRAGSLHGSAAACRRDVVAHPVRERAYRDPTVDGNGGRQGRVVGPDTTARARGQAGATGECRKHHDQRSAGPMLHRSPQLLHVVWIGHRRTQMSGPRPQRILAWRSSWRGLERRRSSGPRSTAWLVLAVTRGSGATQEAGMPSAPPVRNRPQIAFIQVGARALIVEVCGLAERVGFELFQVLYNL